jgi:biofilm PGA synthesis N-glycosyltransferase PgaC
MEQEKLRRYLIISPCRDEAEFLDNTIRSVAAQTVTPALWLIVDDGSTDETPRILAEAAAKYPFIKVVKRANRGDRLVGPGVIAAFYDGLSQVNLDDYDFLCKLDCDLEFPARYFERLIECFEADPWLGTLSGKLYIKVAGGLVAERVGDENSVGPAKFYRTQCFRDIGGFVREVCWDGIDGHMCRLKGWVAQSVDEPELAIVHLRQMGSSHRGIWTGRVRWGRGKYFMGSSPYYVAAVALYRMAERPFVIGGVGIFWGYLKATFGRLPRMQDREYLDLLRRFEREALLFGKNRTTRRHHQEIKKRPAPLTKSDQN